MNKKYFKFSVYLLPLLVCLFLLSVVSVQAATIKYTPNITIPDSNFISGKSIDITADTLAIYIREVYRYGGVIAGAFAMFMLVYASWQWLMAGGNASKVTMAKETINTTLIGLAFLFGGYLLLTQISVNLVDFKPLVIPKPVIRDATVCITDSDCLSDEKCLKKVYLDDPDNKCSGPDIVSFVELCSYTGQYSNYTIIARDNCTCQKGGANLQLQCTIPPYTNPATIDFYCKAMTFATANNDGCAAYSDAEACRNNVCYNKQMRAGGIFDTICGINQAAYNDSTYDGNNCKAIEDVHCSSSSDCQSPDFNYCCADRSNGRFDYCRKVSDSGVDCK